MRKILLATLALLFAVPAFAQAPSAVPAPAPARSAPGTAAAPAAAPAPSGAKVDVNAASADQLATLPGIGPVRSKAIVDHRPYASLADLVKKKALTQGVFDKVRDQLALANINTSSAGDMQRTLPGIGDVRAKAVVAGRPYAQPHDLVTKGVLTEALYDKVKDLVAY